MQKYLFLIDKVKNCRGDNTTNITKTDANSFLTTVNDFYYLKNLEEKAILRLKI